MARLLLLTHGGPTAESVLPALELLPHQVRVLPAEAAALLDSGPADALLVDGRGDLPRVRSLCRLIRTTGVTVPLILVTTEGGLTAVTADWGVDDVVLATAGPAEVEARLRLATERLAASTDDVQPLISNGDLVIDESTYTAKLRGHAARPHLQRVRAAEVPRPAPGPRLHPRPAAAGGLGLRLLRRHPHGRRPRATPARQARWRVRAADRHRPQRRLPLRQRLVLRRTPAA